MARLNIPARGGPSVPNHGKNLEISKDCGPYRRYTEWVLETQVSGSMATRQTNLSTEPPAAGPAQTRGSRRSEARLLPVQARAPD